MASRKALMKILTDVDGVLLNWNKQFETWMEQEDYLLDNPEGYAIHRRFGISIDIATKMVKDFNEGPWLSHLETLEGAKEGVAELVENGYTFDICTAIGTNQFSNEARTRHLKYTFGKNTFDKFDYVDMFGDKDAFLEQYLDTGFYWLEDKPENAKLGADLGLKTIMLRHQHNASFDDARIKTVDNWAQLVNYVN